MARDVTFVDRLLCHCDDRLGVSGNFLGNLSMRNNLIGVREMIHEKSGSYLEGLGKQLGFGENTCHKPRLLSLSSGDTVTLNISKMNTGNRASDDLFIIYQ
jgi:hypothetical protein